MATMCSGSFAQTYMEPSSEERIPEQTLEWWGVSSKIPVKSLSGKENNKWKSFKLKFWYIQKQKAGGGKLGGWHTDHEGFCEKFLFYVSLLEYPRRVSSKELIKPDLFF